MVVRKLLAISVSAVLALVVAGTTVHAGPAVKCAECGMRVDQDSKFSARMTQPDGTLSFCDIGDLLSYLGRKTLPSSSAEVKDYKSGKWIAADGAFYVRAEKSFRTPMGWGIAAFASKEDAAAFGAPMSVADMMKAVK